MPKYVKLFEDAMEPLTGGGADLFKSYIDTKNAFIEDEHAVDDPKAGGIGQVNYHYDVPAPGYLDGTMDAGGKIKEDTTNPPASQQKDGEELLANDDLSNFALPLTNNESQSPKLKRKFGKVMGEFKDKKLKTSAGKTVTNPKQAAAIAYSEAGESKNEGVEIFRFEQFVNEKYGSEQEKMEKNKQKAVKALVSKADKTSGQKKVTAIRKKITKSVSEGWFGKPKEDEDGYVTKYTRNGVPIGRVPKDEVGYTYHGMPYHKKKDKEEEEKHERQKREMDVIRANMDAGADNNRFPTKSDKTDSYEHRKMDKIITDLKLGHYDDGPTIKGASEKNLIGWVKLQAKKFIDEMNREAEDKNEIVSAYTADRFINHQLVPMAIKYNDKYSGINAGIIQAFILQNIN